MPNQVIGHVSFFSGSGLSGASSIATSGNFSKPHTCTLASYLTPDFIFILLLFSFGLDFPTMFILSYCAVYIVKAPSNLLQKGQSYVNEHVNELKPLVLIHLVPVF